MAKVKIEEKLGQSCKVKEVTVKYLETEACKIERKNTADIRSVEKLIILTKAACELLQGWTLCPDCSEAFGYWYRTKGKEDSILIIEDLLRKGVSPREAATLIYQQHKAF